MLNSLLPGYQIRLGSTVDRALLVKFMQQTYQDMFPDQDFSHLARTVEQYLSTDTPLWWVNAETQSVEKLGGGGNFPLYPTPVACLWVGNAVDQVQGDRHAHIFLLYVVPEYRRRGIGTALMHYVENWATQRGDRQIGLQVFQSNKPALNLYHQLGYQTQSLWMLKSLYPEK
nr:GNAT family N-acetyltransferase [Cylindrospermum stagnale]